MLKFQNLRGEICPPRKGSIPACGLSVFAEEFQQMLSSQNVAAVVRADEIWDAGGSRRCYPCLIVSNPKAQRACYHQVYIFNEQEINFCYEGYSEALSSELGEDRERFLREETAWHDNVLELFLRILCC